jgi:hypothetical protein
MKGVGATPLLLPSASVAYIGTTLPLSDTLLKRIYILYFMVDKIELFLCGYIIREYFVESKT